MSTKISNWAWHDPATQHLRGNAAMLLLALADIADDDGHVVYAKGAKRTQEALAKKARMSVSTFKRVTGDLVAQGFLQVTRESKRTENEYRVIMRAQSDLSDLSSLTGHSYELSESSPGELSSDATPLIGHSDVEERVVPPKRGTRIADPFIVTSSMREWAAEHTPLVNVDRATLRFVNYWRAKTGKDATKLDWERTWQNWLLKDQEDQERRPGVKPSTVDHGREVDRILRERAAGEHLAVSA
ncbi:hypothetical protein SCB71_14570 [Herbiconiux sp. KACC 21604]|uniref:hypothetical protein n=1 Tax=unclassified Herbiconiux TaxID=2618217 RepID=UPI0014928B36|nr:hypothetical protein [Herbiconiux sp. SALV-R1]QJU54367.1 hypothetical protein HL652_12510 [Herbiconiux sp. SALV-R1]WPO85437.1 hypothetical protein SCB71_14570 [Herbiconiux sp. KACC 21604]